MLEKLFPRPSWLDALHDFRAVRIFCLLLIVHVQGLLPGMQDCLHCGYSNDKFQLPLWVQEHSLILRQEHVREYLLHAVAFQEHVESDSHTYPIWDETLTHLETVHQVIYWWTKGQEVLGPFKFWPCILGYSHGTFHMPMWLQVTFFEFVRIFSQCQWVTANHMQKVSTRVLAYSVVRALLLNQKKMHQLKLWCLLMDHTELVQWVE